MKKDLLKVCALGLCAVTIVTGCQKNERENSVVKNSNELIYNESENIDKDTKATEVKEEKEETKKEKTKKEETKTEKKDNTEKQVDKKVVKVSIDSKQVGKKYVEVYVNATNKSGKTVWKKDLGKIPYGTGVYSLGGNQGSKYFYLCNITKFEALDIQTGKVVWSVNETLNAATVIEAVDKLFVREGMAVDYFTIFDIKTGKKLKKIEGIQDDYLLKDTSRGFEEYYDLDASSMKYKNGEVTIDVRDRDDNGNDAGKVGYLKINTNTYKIEFVK